MLVAGGTVVRPTRLHDVALCVEGGAGESLGAGLDSKQFGSFFLLVGDRSRV